MTNKKFLFLILIFIFALTETSHAKISSKIVNRVWKNISRAADFEKIPVNYESDSEPNAFVAYDDEGNYELYVTTGLLEILDSEHEIAGVLGHELGHIVLNHYNSFALNDTVSAIMKANIDKNHELAQAIGNIEMELRESKFSREQETEADDYGVKISVKAGYSAFGLYNAMKKFEIHGYGTDSNGFNSHPASDERLKNLRRAAQKFQSEKTEKNDSVSELAKILMQN